MDETPAARTVRIRYEGPSELDRVLVRMLQEDGHTQVAYPLQQERRDGSMVVAVVDLLLMTTGTDDHVRATVDRFLARFAEANPRVSIEADPRSRVGLVAELAELARLHADGHLTDAEFSAAKARLLGGR